MFLSHPALRRDMERYENLLCGTAPGAHEAIARTQVRHVPHRAGVEPVVSTTAGSFATPLRWVLLAPLWLPLLAIGGRRILGECTLILARLSAPDEDLRTPAVYRDVWKS